MKQFAITIIGPNGHYNIHHEVVAAPDVQLATKAAIAAVKERYGYDHARRGIDPIPVVPHPAFPVTVTVHS